MESVQDELQRYRDNELGPNDTFKFKCSMCGSCCRNRDDPIKVTGADVFRIAKGLGISVEGVVVKYMQLNIGPSSHVPVLSIRERLDGSCGFLRKGQCTIQNFKPDVCAMFPLGRYLVPGQDEFHYFKNYPCGNSVKDAAAITLEEWLDAFDIRGHEDMYIEWNKLLVGIARKTCLMPEKSIYGELAARLFLILYLDYKTDRPYIEQVHENMAKAKDFFADKYHTDISF